MAFDGIIRPARQNGFLGELGLLFSSKGIGMHSPWTIHQVYRPEPGILQQKIGGLFGCYETQIPPLMQEMGQFLEPG